MFYMLVRFCCLSSSSREQYVTSVRRGCVTVASASLHMPAHVPSRMPAVLSVTEASGTMVTLCAASIFHSLHLYSSSLSCTSFFFSLFNSSSLSSLSPYSLFPLGPCSFASLFFAVSLCLSHFLVPSPSHCRWSCVQVLIL